MREIRVVLPENSHLGVKDISVDNAGVSLRMTALNSQEFMVLSSLFSLFSGWKPDQRWED